MQAGVITQVHTSYYLGAKNPDVRDALAGFLIGAGENAYFSACRALHLGHRSNVVKDLTMAPPPLSFLFKNHPAQTRSH